MENTLWEFASVDEDSLVLFHTGGYNTFATYLFRRWAYVWLSGKKDTEVVPGERQPHPRCVFHAARFFTAKLSFFEFLPTRRQAEIFVPYFVPLPFSRGYALKSGDRKKKTREKCLRDFSSFANFFCQNTDHLIFKFSKLCHFQF